MPMFSQPMSARCLALAVCLFLIGCLPKEEPSRKEDALEMLKGLTPQKEWAETDSGKIRMAQIQAATRVLKASEEGNVEPMVTQAHFLLRKVTKRKVPARRLFVSWVESESQVIGILMETPFGLREFRIFDPTDEYMASLKEYTLHRDRSVYVLVEGQEQLSDFEELSRPHIMVSEAEAEYLFPQSPAALEGVALPGVKVGVLVEGESNLTLMTAFFRDYTNNSSYDR